MPSTTALMRDRPKASTSTAPAAARGAGVDGGAADAGAHAGRNHVARQHRRMAALRCCRRHRDGCAQDHRQDIRLLGGAERQLAAARLDAAPETVASTVLNTLLTATLVPTAMAAGRAGLTATAPPMAIAVMPASSLALTVTPALATRRTSTRAHRGGDAADRHRHADRAHAGAAGRYHASAPATVTMLPVFAAETHARRFRVPLDGVSTRRARPAFDGVAAAGAGARESPARGHRRHHADGGRRCANC